MNLRCSKYKSTELAVLLGLNYSDWSGIPIRKLLTSNELKEYEAGHSKWGSLKIESFVDEKESRKRGSQEEEVNVISKMPRHDDKEN
ncbi:hypothetical protein COOONC_13734 [Cooperia oncophora]